MQFMFELPEELILDLAESIRLRDKDTAKEQEDKIIRREIRYLTREVSCSSVYKRN
jgi:hypothetical protein